jgi:hypothetical protein
MGKIKINVILEINELIGWCFTVLGFYLMLSNTSCIDVIQNHFPNGETLITRNRNQKQDQEKYNQGILLSISGFIIQGFLTVIRIVIYFL